MYLPTPPKCSTRVPLDSHKYSRYCLPPILLFFYPGNKNTPSADLTLAKLLIKNFTISTPGAKFLGMDLANFYLNNPMPILTSSLMKSLSITTFVTLSLLMDGYTLRFERGCIVFPKPESLQINYLKKALPPKGTTNANIHLVSGAMSGKTSRSA